MQGLNVIIFVVKLLELCKNCRNVVTLWQPAKTAI